MLAFRRLVLLNSDQWHLHMELKIVREQLSDDPNHYQFTQRSDIRDVGRGTTWEDLHERPGIVRGLPT